MRLPDFENLLSKVLSGPNERAISLSHPWLRVFVQNNGGQAAFTIRASLEPDQVVRDGRGFEVKTTRGGNDDYIRFTARSEGIPLIFVKLVETVYERTFLARGKSQAIQAIVEAVKEFRGFTSDRGNRPSLEEVRGRFAELLFLRLIVQAGLPCDVAIRAWRGPFSLSGIGNHDFVFTSGASVEVKSVRQGARHVRVTSADQLVPTDQNLSLLVLPLEPAPQGESFRALVCDLNTAFQNAAPEAREAWADALAALSVDLDDDWFDQFRFQPGNWGRFAVTEHFPHLQANVIPPGIVQVSYSLELNRIIAFSSSFPELIEEIRAIK